VVVRGANETGPPHPPPEGVRFTAGDLRDLSLFGPVVHGIRLSCLVTAVVRPGPDLVAGGVPVVTWVCGGVGVVDALEYDVFISYARRDNQTGWPTRRSRYTAFG
jgi:hypothetical protein